MTTLICDFQDIVGKKIDGYATLTAGKVRPSYDSPSLVVHNPTKQRVDAGQTTFVNVNPGEAVITLEWDEQSATIRFVVPESDDAVYLSDCLSGEYLDPDELELLRWSIQNQLSGAREILETAKNLGLTEINGSAEAYFTEAAEILRKALEAAQLAEQSLETIDDKVADTEGVVTDVDEAKQKIQDLLDELATLELELGGTNADLAGAVETINTLSPQVSEATQAASAATQKAQQAVAELNTVQDANAAEFIEIKKDLGSAVQTAKQATDAVAEANRQLGIEIQRVLGEADAALSVATEATAQARIANENLETYQYQLGEIQQEQAHIIGQQAEIVGNYGSYTAELDRISAEIATAASELDTISGEQSALVTEMNTQVGSLQELTALQGAAINAAKSQAEKGVTDAAAASNALSAYKKVNDPKVTKAQGDATKGINAAAAAKSAADQAALDATNKSKAAREAAEKYALEAAEAAQALAEETAAAEALRVAQAEATAAKNSAATDAQAKADEAERLAKLHADAQAKSAKEQAEANAALDASTKANKAKTDAQAAAKILSDKAQKAADTAQTAADTAQAEAETARAEATSKANAARVAAELVAKELSEQAQADAEVEAARVALEIAQREAQAAQEAAATDATQKADAAQTAAENLARLEANAARETAEANAAIEAQKKADKAKEDAEATADTLATAAKNAAATALTGYKNLNDPKVTKAQTDASSGITKANAAQKRADKGVTDAATALARANEANNKLPAITADVSAAAQTALDAVNALPGLRTDISTAKKQADKGVQDAREVRDVVYTSVDYGSSLVAYIPGTEIPYWADGMTPVPAEENPDGLHEAYIFSSVSSLRGARRYMTVAPGVEYKVSVWLKADKPGSRIFLEMYNQDGKLAVKSGGIGSTGYPIGNWELPVVWTKYEATMYFKEESHRVAFTGRYTNHANGTERNAVQYMADLRVDPVIPLQGDVEKAQTDAENAQSTANTARSEATTKANQALQDATAALTSYKNVNDPKVSTAQSTATTAKNAASTAQQRADKGVTDAATAKSAADTAQQRADKGVKDAATAKSAADIAKQRADKGVADAKAVADQIPDITNKVSNLTKDQSALGTKAQQGIDDAKYAADLVRNTVDIGTSLVALIPGTNRPRWSQGIEEVTVTDLPGVTVAYKAPTTQQTINPSNQWVKADPKVKYYVSFWAKASAPGSRFYIYFDNQDETRAVETNTLPMGSTSLLADFRFPTEWTKYEGVIKLTDTTERVKFRSMFWNHPNGIRADQYLADFRIEPVIPSQDDVNKALVDTAQNHSDILKTQAEINDIHDGKWKSQSALNTLQLEIDENQNTAIQGLTASTMLAFPHMNVAPTDSSGRPWWSVGMGVNDNFTPPGFPSGDSYWTSNSNLVNVDPDAMITVVPGIDYKLEFWTARVDAGTAGAFADLRNASRSVVLTHWVDVTDGIPTEINWRARTYAGDYLPTHTDWIRKVYLLRVQPGTDKVALHFRPGGTATSAGTRVRFWGAHLSAFMPIQEQLDAAQNTAIVAMAEFTANQTKWNLASENASAALARFAITQSQWNDISGKATNANTKAIAAHAALFDGQNKWNEVAAAAIAAQATLLAKQDLWNAAQQDVNTKQGRWNDAAKEILDSTGKFQKLQTQFNSDQKLWNATQTLVNDTQKGINALNNRTDAAQNQAIDANTRALNALTSNGTLIEYWQPTDAQIKAHRLNPGANPLRWDRPVWTYGTRTQITSTSDPDSFGLPPGQTEAWGVTSTQGNAVPPSVEAKLISDGKYLLSFWAKGSGGLVVYLYGKEGGESAHPVVRTRQVRVNQSTLKEVRDSNGARQYDGAGNGNNSASAGTQWLLNRFAFPSQWTYYLYEVEFKPGISSVYFNTFYWNYGTKSTKGQYLSGMEFRPDIPSQAQVDDAQNKALEALNRFAIDQAAWNKTSGEATTALAAGQAAQEELSQKRGDWEKGANLAINNLQTTSTKFQQWTNGATLALNNLQTTSTKFKQWTDGATLAINNLQDFKAQQLKWNTASEEAQEALEAVVGSKDSSNGSLVAQLTNLSNSTNNQFAGVTETLEDLNQNNWMVNYWSSSSDADWFGDTHFTTTKNSNGSVLIRAAGTWIGECVVTAVRHDRGTNTAYQWQWGVDGARREYTLPSPGTASNQYVASYVIHYRVKPGTAINKTYNRDGYSATQRAWDTLAIHTVENKAPISATFKVGWDATDYESSYGIRIRIGGTSDPNTGTVVAVDGPRTKVGPRTVLGNGYRTMLITVNNYSANAGTAVRFEAYTNRGLSAGRKIRDSQANIHYTY